METYCQRSQNLFIVLIDREGRSLLSAQTTIITCKATRQWLLTCKVSRYCLLALHDINKRLFIFKSLPLLDLNTNILAICFIAFNRAIFRRRILF